MDETGKRITDLSEPEFLSFLYSEREREESLSSYQGWNIWAIVGALITVLYACYSVICKNINEISVLKTGYYLSGILGFVLCYRPYSLLLKSLLFRDRGVDFLRVKYLKDVTPKHYLWFSLLITTGFSLFIPIYDASSRFNAVSVFWIIASILVIIAIVYGNVNKDKLVWAVFDDVVFGEKKLDSCFSGILSGILSVVWLQSFKKIESPIVGSPDFELAVCFVAFIALLYLLALKKMGEKVASQIDVLLDDYLYKGRDKELVYLHLRILRMGYGVLEACANELSVIRNSLDDFESQKKKIEELNLFLSNGSFDVNHKIDYIDTIQTALKYTSNCNRRAKALNKKLRQYGEQVPRIISVKEYTDLLQIADELLEKTNEVLEEVQGAVGMIQVWSNVYHCAKYGGWCNRDDCTHRYERKSLVYRIELLQIRFARRLGSIIKPRTNCAN